MISAKKNKDFYLFASGQGSNATSLYKRAQKIENLNFKGLICDQKEAPVLSTFKQLNLPVILLVKTDSESRAEYERRLLEHINVHENTWIFLAGFMRLLSPVFLKAFKNSEGNYRVMNIHPSLLPAFPGLYGYKKAFEHGCKITGCTVHFVNEELDGGGIVAQESFRIHQSDHLEDIVNRGKEIENKLYGDVLEMIARGEIE